jgi:hypothetical protein
VREDSRRFSMHFHGQGTSCKGLWKFPLAGKRPLTCCIKEVTHHKLENQFNVLLTFCQAHMGENLPTSDSGIYNMLSFCLAFFGGLVPVRLCFPSAVVGLCSCPLQAVKLGINPRCLQPLLQLSMEGFNLGASNRASNCRWRGSTWAPPTVLPAVNGGDRPGCMSSFLCHISMRKMDLHIL